LKQNEAAKRSRKRKQELLHNSQSTIKSLEDKNFDLEVRIKVLEKEKASFNARESEMQARIDSLKSQLDEAHMILMKLGRN
jgi:chaperonin cofactor prefoldin